MIGEKTSLLKMKKQHPDRKIRVLRAYFYYRGDKLKYTETMPCLVKDAVAEMEIANKFSGYRLQWRVVWDGEKI